MDVPLPALLFPGRRQAGPGERAERDALDLLVWIDDRGKATACGEGGNARALAEEGLSVLAVDVRGWGETAWVNERFGWSQDRRAMLGADNMLAYVGYMLGHWSVTQRVQDVLGVLRWVRGRSDVDPQRIVLAGYGGGAIVALHAAAVDGGVKGVALVDALATYRSVVDAPRYLQPVADFLPGVLLHYDLPELAAALAPGRVLVLNPQDAMGAPLPQATAEAAYDRAARTADLLGGGVRVETGHDTAGEARLIRQWLLEEERGEG
jgi:pimeloyl-ACP methyl ester carboxylesterase